MPNGASDRSTATHTHATRLSPRRPPTGTHSANRLNGYTFDGGVILAAVLIAFYVHRTRLSGRYLDARLFDVSGGVGVEGPSGAGSTV